MESYSEIQMLNLIPSKNRPKKVKIRKIKKTESFKLLLSLILFALACLLQFYFQRMFIAETSTFANILIIFICNFWLNKQPNSIYSFGYSRVVLIGNIFCYFVTVFFLACSLFYFKNSVLNKILNTKNFYESIFCLFEVILVSLINPPKIVKINVFWSFLDHLSMALYFYVRDYAVFFTFVFVFILATMHFFELLREAFEANPKNINYHQVVEGLKKVIIIKINGVQSVHDLHIWSLSEKVLMTCHLISDNNVSLHETKNLLKSFRIDSWTIQIENSDYECENDEMHN